MGQQRIIPLSEEFSLKAKLNQVMRQLLRVVSRARFVGWFKRSLNQSIGSFSANPHFALLWSDERSDILGIVSDHLGMVTYNFFRNNFFGSLIRTQELNLSCVTVIFAFCGLLTYF